MFVSYVTMEFPSPAETFASNDVRFLTGSGHRIEVHCLRAEHRDAAKMIADRGLNPAAISHNGPSASLSGLLSALKRPRLLWETLSWLWSETAGQRLQLAKSLLLLPRAFDVFERLSNDPPDVVHVYWGHYPAMVGYLVQRSLPDVVTTIGLSAYDLVSKFGPSVTVARAADFVRTQAAVNCPDIESFTGLAEDRIEVVYNGVDLEKVHGLIANIEKVPKSVVSVGRLEAGKAMDDVIKAFALVRERVPTATLVVLGDGDQRLELERLAASLGIGDAVRFEGHVAHGRAIETMAASEVLLFLSKSPSERLPNVVKEAMACGCVCVTTFTPGIEELVEAEVTGFLVEAGDVERSAAVTSSLLNGELDTTAMRRGAVAHIESAFDLRKTATKLASLWAQAVQARHTSPPARP